MNITPGKKTYLSGASLIEAVIAVGVLAVAVPLVMGTIAEAGKSGMSAEAETRSTWIISTCMAEISASRTGQSRYFAATVTGQSFPNAGDVWALAFSPEGKAVGRLSKSQHDGGTKELDGQPIRFIAVLSATPQGTTSGGVPMLKTRVSIQYPAAVPAAKRGKLDYHTLIP
jgi:F0F1-type ATP synthase membrane subunit c/vacuolar-type H+-ATPase subunit K